VTRARPRAIALAALVVLSLAGCVPGDAASPHDHSASPGSPGALVSPVEGVPIDIEAEGFTQVTAFTIRTDDGQQLRFVLGPLENPTQFPPTHLAEHLAGSTRIVVFFRPEGSDEVAYRLEDAPAHTGSPSASP
jgi:outer membrane lipoprotein SlyB